jgi:outer membrane protein insertion porin family
VYNFSYVDPYFTEDGVSAGYSLFFSSTDYDEVNVATYTTDRYGARVNFGYPIRETERLNFGMGYTHTDLDAGFGAVQEIISSPRFFEPTGTFNTYVELGDTIDANGNPIVAPLLPVFNIDFNDPDQVAALETATDDGFIDVNGDSFDDFIFSFGWSDSQLNRGRLATGGYSQSIGVEITVPGSDLEYYKITYKAQYFVPLTRSFKLRLNSVRGYKSNTLGPQSTPARQYLLTSTAVDVTDPVNPVVVNLNDAAYVVDPVTGKILTQQVYDDDEDPFGGNVLVEGSAEILFPMPFIKDQRSIRSALFFDFGNVFDTDCSPSQTNCFDVDLNELRYSVGLGVTWITGFGPLTFSIANPLNDNEFDETEVFQFSMGQSF